MIYRNKHFLNRDAGNRKMLSLATIFSISGKETGEKLGGFETRLDLKWKDNDH